MPVENGARRSFAGSPSRARGRAGGSRRGGGARDSRRPVLIRRGHLPVRDRPQQRHRRSDRPGRGAGGRWPGGPDPVGDVRRHLDPHRVRCRRARGGRHHRAGRPVLRAAARDQPGADEPSDHQWRQRGRLLADQHLRGDHERGGVAQRAAGLPARTVRLLLRDHALLSVVSLISGPGSAAPRIERRRCGGAGRADAGRRTIFDDRFCERSAGGIGAGGYLPTSSTVLAHRTANPPVSHKPAGESVDVPTTAHPDPPVLTLVASCHASRRSPGLDIGGVAITAAGCSPRSGRPQGRWRRCLPTVLLITGIVTRRAGQRIGTIDFWACIAGIGVRAAGCDGFIGAACRPSASTTGIPRRPDPARGAVPAQGRSWRLRSRAALRPRRRSALSPPRGPLWWRTRWRAPGGGHRRLLQWGMS